MSRYWFSILSFLKYFIPISENFSSNRKLYYERTHIYIYIIFIIIKLIQIHAWKTSNILVWLYLFEYIRPRVICQTIFDKLSWNIATKWNFSQTFSIVFVIYWLQIDVIIKTLQHRGLQVIKNIKRWKVEIGLESKVLWSICFYIPIRRITNVPHCIM